MYDFSGKIAVVTGAAQGLGEAIAKRFLNDGIPGVALLDLNEEVLAATAARLDPEGNRVLPVACDVSNPGGRAAVWNGRYPGQQRRHYPGRHVLQDDRRPV